MKRLTHVSFASPIPIPGTHIRQQDFSAHDGWSIEDDDGRIALQRGDVRFYTYANASCVEEQTSDAEGHPVTTAGLPARAGSSDVDTPPARGSEEAGTKLSKRKR